MEKKYKEMTATINLSPQAILGELFQRATQQQQQPKQAPEGFTIKIKPNELKPKQ